MVKATVKTKTSGPGADAVISGLKNLQRNRVYVGVPDEAAGERQEAIRKSAQSMRAGRRQRHVAAAAKGSVTDAQLLYIHTHGSPLRGIPARPVIEPALEVSDNKESITGELKQAATAALDGKKAETKKFMRRAGQDAENRVKKWFMDPRNGWAPNKPSTVKAKGSSRPLIDTAQMRNSIKFIVVEE
jgi:hypothetical protein